MPGSLENTQRNVDIAKTIEAKDNPSLSSSLYIMPESQQNEVTESFKEALMGGINSKKINLSQSREVTKDEKYRIEAQMAKEQGLPGLNRLEQKGEYLVGEGGTIFKKIQNDPKGNNAFTVVKVGQDFPTNGAIPPKVYLYDYSVLDAGITKKV